MKIKTAAIPIFLLSVASIVIVETVNRKKLILTLAVLQVVYRFILDSLFYGGYSFSLNVGVLGVAWADALASLALLITALILIRHLLADKLRNWREIFSFRDWKTYLRVGSWSGLDSLVRNCAYFFMVIRMLNLLGENTIGGYYLAMDIFWNFLLVPFLALAECSRVLIANHSGDILQGAAAVADIHDHRGNGAGGLGRTVASVAGLRRDFEFECGDGGCFFSSYDSADCALYAVCSQ